MVFERPPREGRPPELLGHLVPALPQIEMPDLAALYSQFKDQGLVILAVSDEEDAKVRPFIAEAKYKYPILLDLGDQVNKLFRIQGIPKTFIYDREGRIVAQSIDMRTKKQFLGMLAQAG